MTYSNPTKRKLKPWFKIFLATLLTLLLATGGWTVYNVSRHWRISAKNIEVPPFIEQQYLSSLSSRNGKSLKQVRGVVVHYVGNPGTTAEQNRGYFNKMTTTVNSHFIVGLEGEILQCVPLWEQSCASNDRNGDTISIETCHPDESGQFNDSTYKSLVRLTAWLCSEFDLSAEDVIRHYDVTGKQCPKYYVENPKAWENFKSDVQKGIEENIWKSS